MQVYVQMPKAPGGVFFTNCDCTDGMMQVMGSGLPKNTNPCFMWSASRGHRCDRNEALSCCAENNIYLYFNPGINFNRMVPSSRPIVPPP